MSNLGTSSSTDNAKPKPWRWFRWISHSSRFRPASLASRLGHSEPSHRRHCLPSSYATTGCFYSVPPKLPFVTLPGGQGGKGSSYCLLRRNVRGNQIGLRSEEALWLGRNGQRPNTWHQVMSDACVEVYPVYFAEILCLAPITTCCMTLKTTSRLGVSGKDRRGGQWSR